MASSKLIISTEPNPIKRAEIVGVATLLIKCWCKIEHFQVFNNQETFCKFSGSGDLIIHHSWPRRNRCTELCCNTYLSPVRDGV